MRCTVRLDPIPHPRRIQSSRACVLSWQKGAGRVVFLRSATMIVSNLAKGSALCRVRLCPHSRVVVSSRPLPLSRRARFSLPVAAARRRPIHPNPPRPLARRAPQQPALHRARHHRARQRVRLPPRKPQRRRPHLRALHRAHRRRPRPAAPPRAERAVRAR